MKHLHRPGEYDRSDRGGADNGTEKFQQMDNSSFTSPQRRARERMAAMRDVMRVAYIISGPLMLSSCLST